ncbi:MAG TPA: ABC transporter ATP-binding protein [Candidatus Flavonifractor merdigallinarum]|uniref:Nickel import system ATP-binding protein NikD n=1 Tax=Candidatus Flavonifractor merdigallinarum TaxID=2838589 RepID=A0A9D1Y7E3_9FIRM|nr:ABC transporter ATP-binding protein [Candidatus Flavonifractor merdigallinarum]
MEAILEVEHLSLSFTQYERGTRRRQVTAIRDLSLTVHAGEVAAVVGASGSGKSLLAHRILGLLPYNAAQEGTIRYEGELLTPARAQALRGRELVLVPQGVSWLDPLMKVGPQIRRGDRSPAARAQSAAALERYGLGRETEDLYPFELSGGMARRVLLACAVQEHPRLVVADEPTPGLDAAAARRILNHFRELAEGGAGVLFITHDLELALTVGHRVWVFYAGTTIEESAVEALAAGDGAHPYTRALWNALPQNGFTPLPGTQPGPGEVLPGCPFAPRCPYCRPICQTGALPPWREMAAGRVRCYGWEGGEGL